MVNIQTHFSIKYSLFFELDDQVKSQLKNVAESAGQNAGSYFLRWLERADDIGLAYSNKELVGFSIANHFSKSVLYFTATMISPEFQNKGMGKILSYSLFRHFFLARVGHLQPFLPTYFIFRTQNPLLYQSWYKKVTLFPQFEKEIPEKEKKLAKEIVSKMWPEKTFLSDSFTIINAYQDTPGLRIRKEKYVESSDSRINKLFIKNIGIPYESNDAQLVIGKVESIKQAVGLLFKAF